MNLNLPHFMRIVAYDFNLTCIYTRSVRKVSDFQARKKQAYLERWKPNYPPTFGQVKRQPYLEHCKLNHPQSSLLGTSHTSPSDAAIVVNI